MDQQTLDFLLTHKICCLTTLLPDGTPHSSVMHYSFTQQPFELYLSTHKNSRKCQALMDGGSKGSVVIGFSEEEYATFQLEGTVEMITGKSRIEHAREIYYKSNPQASEYKEDPEIVFLVFKPSWWRYANYKTQPATFLSSK